MINVTFHVIKDYRGRVKPESCDEFLTRAKLRETPLPGELINIKGNPYLVYGARGWALDEDEGELYCYIRLIEDF